MGCAAAAMPAGVRGLPHAGLPAKHSDEPEPAELGVWRMDMETGQAVKLCSLADTYRQGEKREQIVYLVHPASRPFMLLGRFPSTYEGEWRCDLHPRISRDGKPAIIDSPHGGDGRQQYVIDIDQGIKR
jgi:hypothetical protein